MADKGLYRGVYSSMFDDAKQYQTLSTDGRLLLLTLRLCRDCGPAAIFRYYPDVLGAQTGLTLKQLDRAFRELESRPSPQRPWILRDPQASVVWIRNGLRHDPQMRGVFTSRGGGGSPGGQGLSRSGQGSDEGGSARHAEGVRRALAALPKTPLLAKFCRHYGFAMASPKPSPKALERPFPSDARASDSESESESESDSESEKEKKDPPPTSPRRTGPRVGPGLLAQLGTGSEPDDGSDRHRRCPTCGEEWLGGPTCPRAGTHAAKL